MAGLPGSIPSMMPAGQDELVRQIKDLRRDLTELGPSVARSFQPVLDDLAAQLATLTDLVANMVTVAVNHAWVQNFAITTTTTVFASLTFTVPAGYTQALIASVATGMGYNSTANPSNLYVAPRMSGASGGSEVYTSVAPGYGMSLAVPYFDLLTGLTSGQVITISIQMRVDAATWPADPGNVARIDAQATFLR